LGVCSTVARNVLLVGMRLGSRIVLGLCMLLPGSAADAQTWGPARIDRRRRRLVMPATRAMTCLALVALAAALGARAVDAREAGTGITLAWTEGDVAGQTAIAGEGGKTVGVVLYHQHRRGDLLECTRVSRFEDGSSDEDSAVARVNRTLVALRGRSIIRNQKGRPIVDFTIDVAAGRLTGFYDDGSRHEVDEQTTLEPDTYWGPLIFVVVKNFDANAADERVVFKTIAPTPKPRVLTMELVRTGRTRLRRMGDDVGVERFTLRPTFGWLVDPILHRFVPTTEFLVEPGAPPSLARYAGPRNYAGQEIVLQ
jgi:hypothetical protein